MGFRYVRDKESKLQHQLKRKCENLSNNRIDKPKRSYVWVYHEYRQNNFGLRYCEGLRFVYRLVHRRL